MNHQAYPLTPGFKELGGTSQLAAEGEASRAATLRQCVLNTLELFGSMTADECAESLGESVLSIRPRFSELRAMGKIEKTGTRRTNTSGHSAAVWRIC